VPSCLPTSELPDKQWQKSLFLTIAVHVCFVLFSLFAPKFLQFQRKIPEVYTVNLFSVEDLGGPAPAAPSKAAAAPQAEPLQPQAAPEPAKAIPPQKTQPLPEPPAVAKDAISLKPIKTKEKADIDKVKMLRDKLLAENKEKQANDAAEKARADAEKKAKGAVDSLKQALLAGQQAAAGKAAAGSAAAAPRASGPAALATLTGPMSGARPPWLTPAGMPPTAPPFAAPSPSIPNAMTSNLRLSVGLVKFFMSTELVTVAVAPFLTPALVTAAHFFSPAGVLMRR